MEGNYLQVLLIILYATWTLLWWVSLIRVQWLRKHTVELHLNIAKAELIVSVISIIVSTVQLICFFNLLHLLLFLNSIVIACGSYWQVMQFLKQKKHKDEVLRNS